MRAGQSYLNLPNMQDWMESQRQQDSYQPNSNRQIITGNNLPSNYEFQQFQGSNPQQLYGYNPPSYQGSSLTPPNRSDYKALHSGEKGWRRNFRKLRDSTQEQRYQSHLDKRPRI
jgi:hypothetical protein